ncbi:Hydrogenase maturation protein, carbamoyltransferase HypF [Actinacidiphila yanglinensis]|uniref:Carbamoyltransferase n=1 Tax=Actinacidiphila yanglinensis TaxID=310779 RepID=A0A1H6D6L3_9ACTN|nr:carbamoyltransferase HypF [Actinacidiphila yanglinensis]SEG80433.1 Hydrogenase maturation protein, carbamoyltransferase HypF [Actinacidiphila yanglinensis]
MTLPTAGGIVAPGGTGDVPAPAAGPEAAEPVVRRRVLVRGVVQGVGFRPFVYALAGELELAGHVTNTGEGVVAEVEGPPAAVASFCARIADEAPPLAAVETVESRAVPPTGRPGFAITASRDGGAARTLVSPDIATCADCLAELADPADRRYRHPFIVCTNCGPRFTVVTGLPYDRAHTTMAGFPMCAACRAQYADPADRRFHAQPVACPDCGPRLRLIRPTGRRPGEDPVAAARELLADGAVLAVKGLGGYHLACDASNAGAVARLRERKARGRKPFAVMARDLADVEPLARVGPLEAELLSGPQRPVVLLRRRPGARICDDVAPGSPDLGVMLPYTPLHHLLLGLPGDPPGPRLLVMTSGNLSGEPIVTGDAEARERLAGIADAWLAHDRPIHVPCDDSVVRVCDGEPTMLRRSRGYAPLPVALPLPVRPALAVGGDLKNAFCLGEDRKAWMSAHIGDMDDLATQRAFERAERQLESITSVRPEHLAADRHPRYRSSHWAERSAGARPLARVQHHHAHVAAAMAEHGLDGTRQVIGVAFDGTGYGDDGAVWGGEVLLADYDGHRRFGRLGYVPLPGGDAAVRRPYRMALAHLRAAGLPWDADLPCTAACPPDELHLLDRQLDLGLNCVPTSSMGRLFDAVASLAGVCHLAEYEAQAAMEWEAAAMCAPEGDDGPGYAFALRAEHDSRAGAELVADPGPVLAAVAADVRAGTAPALVAARFHRAVAALVGAWCTAARERHGLTTVALTGGVFANALLSSACAASLRADGFTVLRHRHVPPNDGGLALGQLMVAARAATATTRPAG